MLFRAAGVAAGAGAFVGCRGLAVGMLFRAAGVATGVTAGAFGGGGGFGLRVGMLCRAAGDLSRGVVLPLAPMLRLWCEESICALASFSSFSFKVFATPV